MKGQILHLLKYELRQPLMIWMAVISAVVTGFSVLPGRWASAVILMLGCAILVVAQLMKRTPWCADDAFWRTRPMGDRSLFVARSFAILLLGVVPTVVVALVMLRGFGMRGMVFGAGLFGVMVFLIGGAIAAIAAIGSRGNNWKGAAWLCLFGVPIFSTVALAMLPMVNHHRMASFQTFVGGLFVAGVICGLGCWVAWFLVGWKRKLVPSLVVLAVTMAALPWIVVESGVRLFSEKKVEMVSLGMTPGKGGDLWMPVKVGGLQEGEFFVPYQIDASWRDEKGLQSAGGSSWLDSFGEVYSPRATYREVFQRDHEDFAQTVRIEKVWDYLQKQVPAHAAWMEQEAERKILRTSFTLPPEGAFEGHGMRLAMRGWRYEFRSLGMQKIGGDASWRDDAGKIDLRSAEVVNDSQIDVRLSRMTPVMSGVNSGGKVRRAAPPEIWGILYHAPSGTAYGAVSRWERGWEGLNSSLVIRRKNWWLRFELPRLETALLGMDAEKILRESELYLFAAERRGEVTVEWEDVGP